MIGSIFISRDLSSEDIFLNGLKEAGIQVYHQSLIQITPIPFKVPQQGFEWIFLASSNAAKIFLPSYSGNAKVGVAGKATAAEVLKFGYEVDYQGSGGDMDQVGKEFAEMVQGESVVFPCAESGSKRVMSHLSDDQVTTLPIYRTVGIDNPTIPETDAVFLSSPSNAKVFLEHAARRADHVIAIGNTTADFLKENGIKDVVIPENPEPVSILKRILAL